MGKEEQMSDLIVIAYDTEEKGFEALDTAERLQRLELLRLVDAAVVVKDQQGKVKIKQTLEQSKTGTAAAWGALWGLLIGLIFINPILLGAVGGLLGAIIGKTQDLGIDNEFIQEVGDSLEPGNSALCMLVLDAKGDKVMDELGKMGGTVFQTSLSEGAEEKLRQALENDKVRQAAEDSLGLA
jgi:uncharacterized membrane protein